MHKELCFPEHNKWLGASQATTTINHLSKLTGFLDAGGGGHPLAAHGQVAYGMSCGSRVVSASVKVLTPHWKLPISETGIKLISLPVTAS